MSIPRDSRAASAGRAVLPALPPGARITVTRSAPDQLTVVIERRRTRTLTLALDEAAYLHALLGRELPPVTVTAAAPSPAGRR